MSRFFLRRLLLILLVAWGIVYFSFLGIRMSANSRVSQPSYDLLKAGRWAFRDSLLYIGRAWRGDLGEALRGRQTQPITAILRDTYPKSLGLVTCALFIAALLGLPAGIVAALRRSSWLAPATLTSTLVGTSVPSFFTALLLQVAVIEGYRAWGIRLVPVGGFGWDAHLVLPALVLAAHPIAHLARVAFTSLSDVLSQDYIRTAYSKGLPLRRVLNVHAFPNAAISLLTGLGVSFRFCLATLPVVEYYFGWPGIGVALLDGIRQGHAPLVATLALALGLTVMLINLALDLAYRAIDPRLREEMR